MTVTGEVRGQPVRSAEIVIEVIEQVGDTAVRFQIADGAVFKAVAGPLQFGGARPVALQLREVGVDAAFQFRQRLAGPRGGLDREQGALAHGVLIGVDVLCDLLLVHQLLVEAAGLATPQQRRQQVGIGVAGTQNSRRAPGQMQARQFDRVGDRHTALAAGRRRRNGGPGHVGAALERSEIPLHPGFGACDVDVADDRQAGVVRHVEFAEEGAHFREPCGLDLRV
jgi:hypothetical protein